jgi:hypothetical protein
MQLSQRAISIAKNARNKTPAGSHNHAGVAFKSNYQDPLNAASKLATAIQKEKPQRRLKSLGPDPAGGQP